MEIFFALILVVGVLVKESISVRQANKYADTVVRRYND